MQILMIVNADSYEAWTAKLHREHQNYDREHLFAAV